MICSTKLADSLFLKIGLYPLFVWSFIITFYLTNVSPQGSHFKQPIRDEHTKSWALMNMYDIPNENDMLNCYRTCSSIKYCDKNYKDIKGGSQKP